ncbi:phenylacetate--CoA ligase family protein [Pedobacter insulae]|uniref:Phenylacetate-CoA ligase n=1 Tax=Pedobacter insulae TaxID=414048 RepID=A0A1I2TCV3_9SPHI|nr:hypothetical protein [Pedobacter insulae]SFG62685.1 phenylacetate-CoA ligase [Pedobacter insulae]
MNKILVRLKKSNFKIPIGLGQLIARIPFRLRPGLGKVYSEQTKMIELYPKMSDEAKQQFIYERFFRVFSHAIRNVPFYKDLYASHGLKEDDIKCFDDIKKVPVINKEDLLNVSLEYRSYPIPNRTIVNTGGSSGKTLSFYMDPARFGNEWSHIHYIWSKLAFSPNDLKIVFDGRSNVANNIQYDFLRHSLRYDIYADPKENATALKGIMKKHPVYYLHGYPSAIYNFALFCEEKDTDLLNSLKGSLKGVFLSSEFPSPVFRNKIEEIFGVKTQSFYGHTETCVLAYENELPFTYEVLQTYGYCEAIPENANHNLVGTSYYNMASPLIRYNTGDQIDSVDYEDDILTKFKISSGRTGEYILDKIGNKIPLTGLIFGRHHKIFDLSKFVQIKQNEQGKATILYVLKDDSVNQEIGADLFDSSNVNVEFEFSRIDNPIMTPAGKINLLVKA